MKYILAEGMALRGFNHGKEPFLVDLKTGEGHTLNESFKLLLQLCDGKTDDLLFSALPGVKNAIDFALKEGWIKMAGPAEALSPVQVYREVPTRRISRIQWSITGKCNAACRHCFVTDHQHCSDDLTTGEMLAVIQKLSDASVCKVDLTGGEPLLRKDLPILLKAMKEKHITVTGLSTNGFLLDDGMLDLFIENGMRPQVQISFDGVGHHDWMRRVEGAEKMALSAMDSCRRKNLPFSVSMCIHQENRDRLAPTVKTVLEKGAAMFRVTSTDDAGGFTKEKGITRLTPDETYQIFMDYLPTVLKEKPQMAFDFIGFLRIDGRNPEGYQIIPFRHSCMDPEKNRLCTSIDSSFYLSSDGRVLPCFMAAGSFLEEKCMKLTGHSLEECMNSEAYQTFLALTASEIVKRNPECAGCSYLHYCGCGCRGAAASVENNMFGIDRKRCDFYLHGWGERLKEFLDNNI